MGSLFCGTPLSEYLRLAKERLVDEIEGYDRDYLLQVSDIDLQDFLVAEYHADAPALQLDRAYQMAPSDVHVCDRDESSFVRGVRFTVCIPFTGSSVFLNSRPSTYNYNPPDADITENEIRFAYDIVGESEEMLRERYERDLCSLQQYLEWVRADLVAYNESLPQFVSKAVTRRKDSIVQDLGMSSALGVPLKRRSDAPPTYVAPATRRIPRIEKPKPTAGKRFQPEPTLAEEEYENILSIMKSMVHVMERSPHAFAGMQEENLRQHFLVQLNGQYEGRATGETFNYKGKTDILIRVEDRNVFIAECKVWKGPQSLRAAIDQLLAYLSWRDTKTAILLFSRNRRFGAVLSKIPPTAEQHPCFERKIAVEEDTVFRYTFHQPRDPQRKLHLTIMAFDMREDHRMPSVR